MSPTMTDGNIAAWKIQEGSPLVQLALTQTGERFNAGDVLLEIETDKAQMDVEAQDDGVLAKIVLPSGAQQVSVGTTIAILAEEGDDLSSLEPLSVDSGSVSSPDSGSPKKPGQSHEPRDQQEISASQIKQQSKVYPPAVLRLLHEYHIADPSTIHGTGPHGRVLKGDVLAHAGMISAESPKTLRDIIEKQQMLDLSGIIRSKTSQGLRLPPTPQPSPIPPPLASIDTMIQLGELSMLRQRLSGVPCCAT
jgi:pyruvate/2-oxoglutarate dehydrogenase complex dihydrolipoamide acyltransferase (E2) component